jgi:multisubunit Na+/H+ antiporter MnhE subunit
VIAVVFGIILLTATYALVLASFHPWDLAIGATLSALLLGLFRRFLFGDRPARLGDLGSRLVAFVPFAVAVVRDILAGTWAVALVVLHMRPLVCPGIVTVPIEDRSPTGVAVAALVDTLSPGSVLVDVDWERGVMLIHVIDAREPDAIREKHRQFYHRYQKRVFP